MVTPYNGGIVGPRFGGAIGGDCMPLRGRVHIKAMHDHKFISRPRRILAQCLHHFPPLGLGLPASFGIEIGISIDSPALWCAVIWDSINS